MKKIDLVFFPPRFCPNRKGREQTGKEPQPWKKQQQSKSGPLANPAACLALAFFLSIHTKIIHLNICKPINLFFMKHKRKLSILLLLGCSLTYLHAQETIPASGGGASGTGGKASYTIGQMVYSIYTTTNGSVTEGLQQPYEISVISGIKKAKEISLSVTAYPNPANDYLTLSIKDNVQTRHALSQQKRHTFSQLSFQLYNMNGKLLQNAKIISTETTINTEGLTPANYILKIFNNEQIIKTFKIIKNKEE